MRRLRALAASLVLVTGAAFAAPTSTPPSGYRFQIVTGDDSHLTVRIAEDLYKRLMPTFAAFRTELAQQRRMVYIAIGPDGLRQAAARRCDCVVIAAFTSSQVWRAVVAALPPARAKTMTAVYAEPAPADQVRLATLLYRRPVRVAAVLGPDSAFLLPDLAGQAEVLQAGREDDMGDILARVKRSEVLLALPDSAIYNPENIRNILLSTYRRKQAVIGFSADMVKVGALASTYSEIEDINAQVAEMAAAFVATGELPAPQFPHYFRTVINEGVARSLDVAVSEEARRFARARP
ncbi:MULTISPECIES: hypothetical protein [unclassified Massilia]|uniref:hypothetical protein n=1 Tax=unclassified Massilia TaxID=2609279 RepID=UPI0017855660|nr:MULTISPECIES: hypothetical protein [unclassified Massilia]MBD8532708.1 hypothetical protein [Massilia sp. CFBP 13647]MBD8676069.1 hypothetical protein [Massilia sp. CFBP 13721]